jgi:predicted short-subunit dehydrogenase-like oxidoreductase (DUF2520 family)
MKRIGIIGSGNVATHLARAFYAKGNSIVQICSPTLAHAQALASTVYAQATDDVRQLLPADLYIIAVTDSSICATVKELNAGDALVVHTSGSTEMGVLKKFARYGVLYPLQTFSKSRPDMAWESVPVLVEAGDAEAFAALQAFALQLSPKVYAADSALRLQLHTSAVFACNFVNHLLSIAADIAGDHFPLLHPVVSETIEKAFAAVHPAEVQTGPAARNDAGTMAAQLAILPSPLQTLYSELSALIWETRKSINPQIIK